ncbi:hypothetical protein CRG98_027198, partial [Punica granatum]
TRGLSGSSNKLQTTFRNSTGFPDGRFSSSKCLSANLRGTSIENRDHSDPRTSQDIQVCSGLGTFGSAHGHLDPPLRSPTNPTLHCAVTGASVPSHSPETAAAVPSPGSPTHNVQPESCDSHGRFPDSFPCASRLVHAMMGNDLDQSGRGSLGRGLGHGTHSQVSRERDPSESGPEKFSRLTRAMEAHGPPWRSVAESFLGPYGSGEPSSASKRIDSRALFNSLPFESMPSLLFSV